ncbi:hypothetical protein ACG3SL_18975 [Sphingomonas sp. CJ20]
MSDATLSPEPAAEQPRGRSTLVLSGLAFAGGIAVTAAAFQLGGALSPRATTPAPVATTAAPVPQTPAAQASTLATLDAREAELSGRLDQLSMRLRDTEGSARAASGYATRAERLMIAFAVRRAIERGQPLGPLEAQLRARFGDAHGEAVGAILRAAAEPVTIEDLRLALDTIAPRLINAPDDSLWMHVRRLVGDLVVLRPADAPSPRASDRLRRARRTLDAGQVEAALGEVSHLPGVNAAGSSWVAAARRFVAARHALTEIEQAAIEAPLATPPLEPPVATTPGT